MLDRFTSYGRFRVSDKYETRITTHFNMTITLLLVCVFLSLVTNLISDSWRMHDTVFYVGSSIIVLVCFGLNAINKVQISKIFFFLAVAIMLALEAVLSGNVYMNSLCSLASLVLAFRFLLRLETTIMVAAFQLVSMILPIYIINYSTYTFDPSQYDLPILQAIVFSLVFIALCLVMFFINRDLREHDLEKKTLINTLEKNNLELANAYNAIENYALVTSHDLKGPLVNINSFVKLIKKMMAQGNVEKATEYLTYVESSGDKLAIMIDDILESSRLASETNVNEEKINMNALFAEIGSDLKINYPIADIQISEIEGLYSNKSILRVVFQNLIENGLKYNTSVHPQISISAQRIKNHLSISVQDNGIGITQENQKNIFELFNRIENSDNIEGYGVGLYNCKSIIENRLNGTIEVESNLGEGTTVIVNIPLEH